MNLEKCGPRMYVYDFAEEWGGGGGNAALKKKS